MKKGNITPSNALNKISGIIFLFYGPKNPRGHFEINKKTFY